MNWVLEGKNSQKNSVHTILSLRMKLDIFLIFISFQKISKTVERQFRFVVIFYNTALDVEISLTIFFNLRPRQEYSRQI